MAGKRLLDEMFHQLPEAVTTLTDELVNELAADLGESPEAWRGAVRMAREIGTGVGVDPRPVNSEVAYIMLMLARFLTHPMAIATLEAGLEP
jgi:hypothetical protein